MSSLSVGERQRVEILRALLTDPKLLILDEPTAVLTPQMAERLFVTLRQLADAGCSILYISHKLDEVRALCSRCTVLRGGRVTGTVDPRQETNRSLSELMLGAAPPAPPVRAARVGEVRLEVRELSLAPVDDRGVPLARVDLTVRGGEILGVAGVSGNGQGELLAALSGEDRRAPAGSVRLFGRDVSGAAPRTRRALGLHFVPEERIGRGSVPGLSLSANTLLTRRETVGAGGWLHRGRARRLAARLIERFDVRAGGPDAVAGSLSGGNLQKFIVGREVDAAPKVLIVAQPTWGLDVGAAAQIRREIAALCDAGAAALIVSEDLEELFELCTDLVVIARGRLSPRIAVRDATSALIGQWMSGLFTEKAQSPPARSPAPAPPWRRMLRLVPRTPPSRALTLAAPLIALALTVVFGGLLFLLLGHPPGRALALFFIEPLRGADAWSELAVKATPLALIALGLAVCFRANVWNIGAEGQFIVGALGATAVAMRATTSSTALILPAIALAGICAGMAWAAVVALLRDRWNANEILVSLMLVYVAEMGLGYLVYGPWKDPEGFNFPQTITFLPVTQVPLLAEGYRAHVGLFVALATAVAAWLFLSRTYAGFQLSVGGQAPRAARYAGFSARRSLWTAMLASGGLAGLAGALEVTGPLGQLTPHLPVGYGFTGIIVAFVGRLHPLGIVLSSILMSMLYIGGELAQSRMGLPQALSGVFQGLLLFTLLACDALASYRVLRVAPRTAPETAVKA